VAYGLAGCRISSTPPDYKILQQAVHKAFRRYCQRNPALGLAEMRRVDTQRCDDIYRAMLPIIRSGGRGSAVAADAATRALAHKARINGMDAPIKIAATDRQGRNFAPIPIETIRRIKDGGEVVFDAEPNYKPDDEPEKE